MDSISPQSSKSHQKSVYKLWAVLAVFFVVFAYIVKNISGILLPFVSGAIGAYIFSKPAKTLENKGFSRTLATLFIIVGVITVLVVFGFLALPFIKNELVALVKNLPNLSQQLVAKINPILDRVSQNIGSSEIEKFRSQFSEYMVDIVGWLVQIMINLLSNGLAIANLISLVFLTPLIMFYILKDWDRFTTFIDRLWPKYYADDIRGHLKKIDETLGAYARGQVMVCLALVVLYSVVLWALGLPHAFFIGFITGFFAFVPYMGAVIGFTAAMAIALNHYDSWMMIVATGSVFIINSVIEGYFLTPRFIGDRIGLHPVLIIFALLSLGSLFGLVGVVFALPLAAIILTVLRAFMHTYREKFVV